jgi:hypothetical protein
MALDPTGDDTDLVLSWVDRIATGPTRAPPSRPRSCARNRTRCCASTATWLPIPTSRSATWRSTCPRIPRCCAS